MASEGNGTALNRSEIWQPLIQEDWTYADVVPPSGTRNVQEGDEEFKVKDYKNVKLSSIPRSQASGADVGLVCLFDNIDPALDGQYFLLEGASGKIFNTDLTIRNVAGQFTANYNWGQPAGKVDITVIMKVGNNFFFRWNDVRFDDVELPATFTYEPDPDTGFGGSIHIDWLYTIPSGTAGRRASSHFWFDFEALTYSKFDILARPISEKYLRSVVFDGTHYVCIKTHTHTPGDATQQPNAFQSIYWQRIRNTFPNI